MFHNVLAESSRSGDFSPFFSFDGGDDIEKSLHEAVEDCAGSITARSVAFLARRVSESPARLELVSLRTEALKAAAKSATAFVEASGPADAANGQHPLTLLHRVAQSLGLESASPRHIFVQSFHSGIRNARTKSYRSRSRTAASATTSTAPTVTPAVGLTDESFSMVDRILHVAGVGFSDDDIFGLSVEEENGAASAMLEVLASPGHHKENLSRIARFEALLLWAAKTQLRDV